MEFLLILLDSMEFLNTPLFDAKDFWKLVAKTFFNLIVITIIIRKKFKKLCHQYML